MSIMLALVMTTLDQAWIKGRHCQKSHKVCSRVSARRTIRHERQARVLAVEVTVRARVAHRQCSHGMHLGPHTKCGTSCQN